MGQSSVVGILLIVVIGLAMAGFGGYMWMEQGERIDSYEQTEATVVSSDVDRRTSSTSEGGTSTTYYPEVTYEYTVDGEAYQSENVMPGPGETGKGQRGWAEGIVEDHPEGETVTAYYDPEDPSNAFLVKNREVMFLGVAGFGGLFALLGVWSLVKRLAGAAT